MSFLWNKIADDGIFRSLGPSDLSGALWSVPSARLRWGADAPGTTA